MGGVVVEALPGWVTLLRAPNPGPMTLDGTNTWVLRAPGSEHGVVIDPGPLDEDHLKRIAEHGPFAFILITHGHHDHVEGVERLSELLGGCPVMPDDLGGAGLEIELIATPGHTADSVCFLVGHDGERVMFTGDTVLGRGTTVVAAPDGDLGAYLSSLTLLGSFGAIPVLPGHGPALDDLGAVTEAYLAHRAERLAQVEAAMAAGADTPEKVVDLVYPDIDPGIRFAAEWSAAAQLDYLRHKNRESGRVVKGLDGL